MRAGTAHTKDRSEVRGGGKKPWRQKGTGRARHGSRRSPIWTGGGIAFGPRVEKSYDKKINKKVRTKALYTILSKKFADGELVFVDGLSFEKPKTAEAREFLKALDAAGFDKIATKRKNAALITLPEYNEGTIKSFKNISPIATEEIRNVSVVDLLSTKYVVLVDPEVSIAELKKRSKSAGLKTGEKKTVAKKETVKKTVAKKAATKKVAKKEEK